MTVARFPVLDVSPVVDAGARPAKAVVGEAVPVRATAFREGHDSLGVEAVLLRPDRTQAQRVRMVRSVGIDRWTALLRPDAEGIWHFRIDCWDDPWATWLHRAEIKVPAGVDIDLELAEGARLLEQAADVVARGDAVTKEQLREAAGAGGDTTLPPLTRLAHLTTPEIRKHFAVRPLRRFTSSTREFPLRVERRRALTGAWYEFFPRSEAEVAGQHGTFASAARRLPAIAAMGFDVVYLPPIHPIGRSFRKGPNNSLVAGPDDPGSPWAIGSTDGGHDAVHPQLGTLADFDAFVAAARAHGLEVALDLALQASPDHPWVSEHPEWFTTRADGSIAYAENPPKKYQDVYPLNFDNDPEGLYAEVVRIVRHWMAHGVRIFRVDNPHTKPLWVWDRLIGEVQGTDPDVLFLAEAFTAAPMMRALAEIGFSQSYTYFTWRNDRAGLEEYFAELAGPAAAYMRPNAFVNTPDILPEYLQYGGPAAFAIRAVLAATLSPTWGVYSGYELFEHAAVRHGSEEYLDSEKYQLRPRAWEQPGTLVPLIKRLNELRRVHPALQDLRSLHFHHPDNDGVIAYSKRDGDDLILVVCTLDPISTREATVWWDLEALGLPPGSSFEAHDLLTGGRWTWGQSAYVRLDPGTVAHIVHVPGGHG